MPDTMRREALLRAYLNAWLTKDPQALSDVFSPDIVYSECYGPEYRGLAQVKLWFDDWNRVGTVLEWQIKRFIHQGSTTVIEWRFRNVYFGKEDCFDGVTLADFDASGKIVSLREFYSKAEHILPYADGQSNDDGKALESAWHRFTGQAGEG